jgi:hypothetical protein
MGNYVIEAGKYVIVSPSELRDYKIADSQAGIRWLAAKPGLSGSADLHGLPWNSQPHSYSSVTG